MADEYSGGILAGVSSQTFIVKMRQDNTGANPGEPITGLVYTDFTLNYLSPGSTLTAFSAATLSAIDAAYKSGGVIEISAANAPGLYRIDLPNAFFTAGVKERILSVVATGALPEAIAVPIVSATVQQLVTTVGAAGAGLTALGDTRLANLDAAVSDCAVETGGKLEALETTIGAAGAGLTALGDTRLANLDAAVSDCAVETGGKLEALETTIGTAGAGLTALGDTRLANLDAAVSDCAVETGGKLEALETTVGAAGAGLTALGDTRLANLDAAVSDCAVETGGKLEALETTIGAAGAGLTALGDTRLGNLDAAVSTRSTFDPTSDKVSLADGAHGGTSATLALKSVSVSNSSGNAVTLASTGSNGIGLAVSGNGSGEGMKATGGATAAGIKALGGATSGAGVVMAAATSGDGLTVTKAGTGTDISDARLANLDAAISDVPTDVDTELSTSHGSGSWDATATAVDLNDTATTKGIIAKAIKDQNVSGTAAVTGSVYTAMAKEATLGSPAVSVTADIAAVKGDTAAILLDTGTDGVLIASAAKTGMKLASDGLDQVVVETGENARQTLAVVRAATLGVSSGNGQPVTTARVFKAKDGATTRISGTIDADGNRTAVTVTLPT